MSVRGIVRAGRRVFGYTRDQAEKRIQKDARELLGALKSEGPLPMHASLAQFRAPILDQGPTGSCTGHGTAQALYTAAAAAGMPLPWVPSPLGIYTATRCLERRPLPSGALPNLVDGGAQPADVMTAVGRYGIREMGTLVDNRLSDVNPDNVNLNPDFAQLEESGQKLIVGEYRIEEGVSDVIDQVRATIAIAQRPVGIGIVVDSAFMNWNPGTDAPLSTINTNDPNAGGHWIDLDEYTSVDGKFIFTVVNSWGLSAGKEGTWLVTEDWVRQAWDLYAWTVKVPS